jgi:hypothetical protein
MKRENSWATLFIALLLSTITLTLIGLANANPIPPPPILEVYIRELETSTPSQAISPTPPSKSSETTQSSTEQASPFRGTDLGGTQG